MTRQEKAVETAALWKTWKNGSIQKPTNEVRFFHRYHSAWKTARAARSFPTVTHRFYYWIHKQIPSGPPRGPGIDRSGQPTPSSRAHSTPAPGSRSYTSPRKASRGIEMSRTRGYNY